MSENTETELTVVVPSRSKDFLSDALRDLTMEICKRNPESEVGGFLGGRYGYGVDFENSVFVMRPYYWGDCDCGYEQREDDWSRAHKHSLDCYQSELRSRRIATGMWEVKPEGQFEYWLHNAPYEKYQEADAKICDDLCAKFNLDRSFGAAVHCTCDHEPKWNAFCDTPEGTHYPTCAVELPNYRHKATGFEVRWYKYIGRDNELKNEPPDMGAVLSECFGSLGKT